MAILNILHYPDPRLRNHAKPVAEVTESHRRLIKDMLQTMYAAPGIGLAAIQVGVPERVIVVDVSDDGDQPLALINPEILAKQGTEVMQEGCLSVPGVYEEVERAERIRVRALDAHGKRLEFEADGLLAVCIQHEIDHLNGKLFVDYLPDDLRQGIRKRVEKEERERQQSRSPSQPSV